MHDGGLGSSRGGAHFGAYNAARAAGGAAPRRTAGGRDQSGPLSTGIDDRTKGPLFFCSAASNKRLSQKMEQSESRHEHDRDERSNGSECRTTRREREKAEIKRNARTNRNRTRPGPHVPPPHRVRHSCGGRCAAATAVFPAPGTSAAGKAWGDDCSSPTTSSAAEGAAACGTITTGTAGG